MSKTFEEILTYELDIYSVKMAHEGGTKFYEMMLLQHSRTISDQLFIARWGGNVSRDKNGTFGKGKILTAGAERYMNAAIRNKENRGYKAEPALVFEGHNAYRIASDYKMIRVPYEDQDPETLSFFAKMDFDVNAITPFQSDPVLRELSVSIEIPQPKVIQRSPLFGSW